MEYPVPHLPSKSSRPSREAVEGLLASFDELLDLPVAMAGKEADMTLVRLNMLYVHMAKHRLGLSKRAGSTAETRATQLAELGIKAGLKVPRAVRALESGEFRI